VKNVCGNGGEDVRHIKGKEDEEASHQVAGRQRMRPQFRLVTLDFDTSNSDAMIGVCAGNEPFNFKSRLVSPAGTKGGTAGAADHKTV
jgi:hypothetical protein